MKVKYNVLSGLKYVTERFTHGMQLIHFFLALFFLCRFLLLNACLAQ